jgi:hypothetical protein
MTHFETDASNADFEPDDSTPINEPRLWHDKGWTARVIKNEDDEGWAVEMIKNGESEPALVGPWTMGRDKKNPKPLDSTAFNTLVKTAGEFRQRQVQQRHAALHSSVTIYSEAQSILITLDIVPDDDDPYAVLTAHDDTDTPLARIRVGPGFKLNNATANAWAEDGFRAPD